MLTKSEKQPPISVVILNYNGREFIEPCLRSVLNTDYPNFEVVFVDNASTDGSIELVKERFGYDHRLKIISNDRNLGFAEGNNVGMKATKGDHIVLLNNDTEVNQSWLKEIVRVLEADSAIGAAQCKLMSMHNRGVIDCTGGFIDRYGWSHRRGEGEKDEGQYDEVDEIFYAVGAALAARRNILNKVGMFEPKFFIYFEDVDLCWRIWLSGFKVVFIPTSLVFHVVRGTMKRQPVGTIFLGCKNNISTLLKNYELHNIAKYLPANLAFIVAVATFQLLKGRVDRTTAYLRGILWNLVNLKHIWKKRMKVQRIIRKIPDEHLIQSGLILRRPLFAQLFLKEICEGG